MHRVTLLAVACSLAASAQTSSPVGNSARTPAEIVVTVGHYFGPQIGIAKTAFFPTVTLSASAGFESLAFTKWLAWPSRVWSVGPSLAQTIFDTGLRKATVQQFQASSIKLSRHIERPC